MTLHNVPLAHPQPDARQFVPLENHLAMVDEALEG